MPLDSTDFFSRPVNFDAETTRLYVAEIGVVRIETPHFRREFSPEEFVAHLRELRRNGENKKND